MYEIQNNNDIQFSIETNQLISPKNLNYLDENTSNTLLYRQLTVEIFSLFLKSKQIKNQDLKPESFRLVFPFKTEYGVVYIYNENVPISSTKKKNLNFPDISNLILLYLARKTKKKKKKNYSLKTYEKYF